ncbi:phenylpropionate dioxygenase-like ring-hydroxylating dioxygenase large terminal subunit [Actinocorallia herbida]|uniref:Phenylpropionate dioxygenase-like ring-hydroxylating dioxygenase large terminal subunit n=1 Tax=Actinocorallia herbida TaxID=58109 RepID=A0A3N1CVI1_9ACTN|nr:aromatic ring-hydroxylating dioxygenase subunit alpha [Actinocorallia herbida]ROO85301.1 phenylpropionate dioxygenase-like ring-hydroxylating dioxygenase large terminal subunit [Actinocorallia herbida]
MTLDERGGRIERLLDLLREDDTDKFEGVVPFGPQEFTDPGIAAREREMIFGRVPSIVAHSAEIARPGAFLTLQMPRNKVIVVRQRDGGVKAFVNACRHRGALLEDQPSGQCRIFSCGYHRWSYDTDGSLRTVTYDHTFGEVDKSASGLIELPAEERHGFIWLVDNAAATIDVGSWLGPEMDTILASYSLDTLLTYQAEGFDEPVNWKVMQDAFLDGYHIKYAHPNTAGKIIHTNVLAVEDYGAHARFLSPRKSIDRFLEEDHGDADLGRHVTESHFLGPNSTLLRQPDHYQLLTFRPHPTDPGRSRMEMRVMVPDVEASGLDEAVWERRWAKNWQILLDVLHAEDFPLLRASQEALGSADAGGMLLGRNEVINQIFHRQVRALTADR